MGDPELQVAHVRQNVAFSLITDFEGYSVLKATDAHAKQLSVLLDQLVSWGTALQDVREQKLAVAA